MKSGISYIRWLWFIGGAAILAFFTIVILLPDIAVLSPVQNSVPSTQSNLGLPIRLKIPAISVDAAVEYVGIAPDGTMDVPKGPQDVAWFNLGPRPGENGTAVIAGHYGWKNGIPAVFDTISTLHKGDRLFIEDDKGLTTTFVVRELRTFDEKGDSSSVFSSDDEKAHLNLITCEGVWNAVTKSYSERLVVFTDKE